METTPPHDITDVLPPWASTQMRADWITEELPPWASTQQVADWIHVPVATVHQWRHRGLAPRAYRIGRHLRFRREDIAEWLDAHADPRPGAA